MRGEVDAWGEFGVGEGGEGEGLWRVIRGWDRHSWKVNGWLRGMMGFGFFLLALLSIRKRNPS